MDLQLEKIRDTQKESWNQSSSGWKKWDEMFMHFLRPVGDEMINMLRVNDKDYIMDVATGTGEPGLTIAALLSHGKVIGTDLAEDMLTIAMENALKRGIYNFETACCDVSALPFEDETFDSICCRCGFMFFPNMDIALQEMMRVLKPGGRIVAAVWNIPEKNFWISASMETMISKLQLKQPVNGAPGLFRCAQPGLMADMFRKSGLKEIEEKEINGQLICESPETYWNFITEAASPLAFKKADESLRQEIKREVLNKVLQKYPSGKIEVDSSSLVICGEKKYR